jgi:hypothetical protein
MTRLHGIKANDRLVAQDGGNVPHPARDRDPITWLENRPFTIDNQFELSGNDRVDLVHTVRMFWKVSAW